MTSFVRHDWNFEEVEAIYSQPFADLLYQAQTVHRENFKTNKLQRSSLLSIKTGACSEDCAYCAQSSRHDAKIEIHRLLPKEHVLEKAREARESGSTRFCMSAAWREVKSEKDFDYVLDLVREVCKLGLESCCTLGLLTEEQAVRLKEAGCFAYNHNLDTSPEYYENIVTTHSFEDRLVTLQNVRKAGLTVCSGGIVGMGESFEDRIKLLISLATQNPHPDSVPINLLIPIEGTPLAGQERLDPIEFIRTVAAARILMPQSFIRLGAGRTEMSDELQAICFSIGANSVFAGEKLLTAPNPEEDRDSSLFKRLGLSFLSSSRVESSDEKIRANAEG